MPRPPVEYGYDDFGRRVSKTVGTMTTTYVYNGSQVIAEYEDNGIDPEYLARKFIYGPGLDEPIVMIDVDDSTETWYFYHYDGLGSVVALSKLNGSTVEVVERYAYTAFGETTILSPGPDMDWTTTGDNTTLTESDYGNPTMFTGRRYDDETGLYYYRARMYSPELGRFMQTDPIGYADGMNMYAYCDNNPVNWIDPWGLEAKGANEQEEELDEQEEELDEPSWIDRITARIFRYRGINELSVGSDGKTINNAVGDIIAPPPVRGRPPIGSDGHPIELHHQGQQPDSPVKEMTRTDHRGKGNFKKNHENVGQESSKIDRKKWKKKREDYWKSEWDKGRFDDMPD